MACYMDLELPPQHAAFRDSVREIAQAVALPLAAEVDRDHRFPEEAVSAAAEAGLLGVLIPREFGGAGLDALAFALCIDELAQACASTSVIVDVHTSVGSEPILLFGTQDQKRKWLPRLASGERVTGSLLIGADGLWSNIRKQVAADGPPRVSGHTTYRSVIPTHEMPEDLRWNAATLWAGPKCHLVHYPLSGWKVFNLVITCHNDARQPAAGNYQLTA